jgi:hypothetical protein
MPGGDRTGPRGAGPMSGRAAGFCNGYDVAGFANRDGLERGMQGRGMVQGVGGGRVRGRGCRNTYKATGLTGWQRGVYQQADQPGRDNQPVAPAELTTRKSDTELILQELSLIKDRLSDLESRIPGDESQE